MVWHIAPKCGNDKFVPKRETLCGESSNGLTDYMYPSEYKWMKEHGYTVCQECEVHPDLALHLLSTIDDEEPKITFGGTVTGRVVASTNISQVLSNAMKQDWEGK